jgi:hypothetical protein
MREGKPTICPEYLFCPNINRRNPQDGLHSSTVLGSHTILASDLSPTSQQERTAEHMSFLELGQTFGGILGHLILTTAREGKSSNDLPGCLSANREAPNSPQDETAIRVSKEEKRCETRYFVGWVCYGGPLRSERGGLCQG